MTIAKNAMLIRLSIAQMGLSHRDNAATILANAALNTGRQDAGYFRKFRVQRSDVAAITAAVSKARSFHRHYTTPFGDDNWRLLSSTLVMKYTQEMRSCRQEFESAVADLINNWPTIISRNQQVLGSLFDHNDYPAQGELNDFYSFKTEFRPVPQSDHLVLQIESETLEKLKKSIEQQNNEANEAARKELWKRLYDPVQKMAERLSDKSNKFHDSLIGNIESIVDILPDLNAERDPKLINMANEIKSRLCGYTPGQLRVDHVAREQTANEALALMSKMDSFMGVSP